MTVYDYDIANRAGQKLGVKSITALSDSSVQAVAFNRAYTTVRDDELRKHNWNFAIKRTGLSAPYVTITAITAATPPVVTYTGTDPSNGDRIYIEDVEGMTEVNGRYFRIANIDTGANTLELTDETTGDNIVGAGYTAYTSGGTGTICPYWGYGFKFAIPSDMLRLISIDGYTGVNTNIGGYGHSVSDYTIEKGYILTNDSGPIFIRYVYQSTDPTEWDINFREAVACKLALECQTEILQSDSRKSQLIAEYLENIRIAKLADSIEVPGEPIPDSDWLMARI